MMQIRKLTSHPIRIEMIDKVRNLPYLPGTCIEVYHDNHVIPLENSNLKHVANFLERKLRMIENELDLNASSKAFENYQINSLDSLMEGGAHEEIKYWKTLSVDLEKYKVTYPDWASAKHIRGKIAHVNITRTKQRVYDIDYDDGTRLKNVREEYIRIVEDSKFQNDRKTKGKLAAIRLQEGVRVHVRVSSRNGEAKFYPGRIAHVSRGGGYEVEVEGGKVITGITIEDLVIGIDEGQAVEALKPLKIELQAMDMTWNITGSSIIACYGRDDISGWCNYPGAVVIWNVFGSSQASEPDLVLDHNICLMSIACHPENPSIIAAGSFNGEIIVWDLNTPEQPIALSPITEYSHKEPVLDLTWVHDTATKIWLLVSLGADGRVLFWDYKNTQLAYPIRGSILNKAASGRSIRSYPSSHSGSSMLFTANSFTSRSNHSSTQWTIIGQDGGQILRIPTTRFFDASSSSSSSSGYYTKESFKALPSCDDLYTPIKRSSDTYSHDAHVGCVNALHASTLSRNIFLSAGADGSIKLFHLYEKSPLKQWDPAPASMSSETFSPIADVKFSPIRATVFAAASADGYVYLYDLAQSLTTPAAVLDTAAAGMNEGGSVRRSDTRQQQQQRVGLTALAFNHRQRDLLAACDRQGKIHLWRLSWKYSNRQDHDANLMESITRPRSTSNYA
jgi:WD repeat-containing protein 34